MPVALRRRVSSIALLAVAALFASLFSTAPVRAGTNDGPAPVDARVLDAAGRTSALLHVRPQASLRSGLDAAHSAGLETGTVYDAIDVFVAYGSAREFSEVARSGAIQYVEANRRIRLFTNSSHKATRGQELLDGNVTLPGGVKIDGSGVGVAIVDSGVDGTHPDLTDRMGGNVKIVCSTPQFVASGALGGFSECLGPKTAVPLEDTDHPSAGGHGTHVAGIIAGTGAASNKTYHGAAPGATIYGVSVGTTISVENGLDGLAWVLENHDQVSPAIKVVNNSWGSSYSKYKANGDILYSATWKLQEALIAEGVTVVFAAGNAGGTGSTPTTVAECVNPTPGLVCVANYDDKGNGTRSGTISTSSSRGKTNEPESWPDISAPGTSITSTCRYTLPVCHANGGLVTNPANTYAIMSGTSMAAPHVAGIVAQLYQADPTLTPAEIEGVLEDTAHKFAFGSAYGLFTDPTNPDNTSSFEKGHGLVDAVAAVQAVLGNGTSTEPTLPPTIEPSATPTPTTTPSSTPAPTATPAGGTRYYFHSASGVGNADLFLTNGHPFDTTPPTLDAYSEYHDLPDSNGGPNAIYDPNWVGTIQGGPFSSLTLDFWVKSHVAEVLDEVNFDATVWVGATAHELPTLTAVPDTATISDIPAHVTGTFTTMLDDAGNQVPLSIDPAGQPVTISIAGHYPDTDTGFWVVYDSVDHPSGFSVGGGVAPTVDPTVSPSATPTATPTATPGPGGRGTYPTNPDDPLFANQWGMTKIKAPEAWQEDNATGFGINLAVVDSGLDLGHEDFACAGKLNVLPGSNIGSSSRPNEPQDADGHGTHVAGIAGACTDNGKGVVGVAPDATIMPVRVFDEADLDKAMADGVRFATDHGAHVINLSIGDIPPFSHFGPDGYPQTEEALAYARNNGVVIAAAAGNFDQPTCEFPSMSRNVICVVATDRDDVRSYYSDFPVNVDRNADEPKLEPVIAAPGGQGTFCEEGITSTYLRTNDSTCHTSGYDSIDGTSMSSPHVAGVAALLYDRLGGVRSKANADLIVQTILDTADDLYSPGWDPIVGFGRLNALEAVRAIPTTVVEPTPTPTPTPTPAAGTAVEFTQGTAETAQFTDQARLEAVLTNTDTSQPIPGAELVFRLTGAGVSREVTATTDTNGIARVTLDVTDRPGAYDVSALFAGREGIYEGAADLRSLEIVKEDSTTALTVQGNGSRRTLTARLTDRDRDGYGLGGRVVRFFSDGALLGTATTNAQGVATLDNAKHTSGNRNFEAVFEGDDFFTRSTGRAAG